MSPASSGPEDRNFSKITIWFSFCVGGPVVARPRLHCIVRLASVVAPPRLWPRLHYIAWEAPVVAPPLASASTILLRSS